MLTETTAGEGKIINDALLSTLGLPVLERNYNIPNVLFSSFRYEHTKPLKQEIIGDASGARSSPLESLPETSSDINSKKAASEVAAGVSQAEDWVNAVEFVPGQLYCGRGNCLGGIIGFLLNPQRVDAAAEYDGHDPRTGDNLAYMPSGQRLCPR